MRKLLTALVLPMLLVVACTGDGPPSSLPLVEDGAQQEPDSSVQPSTTAVATTAPTSTAAPTTSTSSIPRTEPERVPVFVIAREIPAGESWSSVMQTLGIEIRDIQADFVPENALLSLEALDGTIAALNIAPEQMLVEGMFLPPGE